MKSCSVESVALCLYFQDLPQPVSYFYWGFPHRSHRREETPCHETVPTSLPPALDSSHQPLQQLPVDSVSLSANPCPSQPCSALCYHIPFLHPGCHRSGSPRLWQGGGLQTPPCEMFSRTSGLRAGDSMPCSKGRMITIGPCPGSLWYSPS